MVCTMPIGFGIMLISFVVLKVTISQNFPNLQDNFIVTIDALTRGIQALLAFCVILFVIFILDLTQDFVYLLLVLVDLLIFNVICIYFINSRPQLKAFVKAKFHNLPFIPKPNTVEVEIST